MLRDYFYFESIAKNNEFIKIVRFDKIINYLFISENELYIYNVIINFFAYEMIIDINILNISIKLNVLYKSDNILIII